MSKGKAKDKGKAKGVTGRPPRRALRLQGLLFGVAFGFLLQKGGVAQYDVLVGALLLTDFTVFQVMLSAILVGMVGIATMRRLGLVSLHPKPLRPGANIVGGLLFGVGFGLSGYCPGTGAAAAGQGNLDALVAIAGMIVGSYLYAELVQAQKRPAEPGPREAATIDAMVPVPRSLVVLGAAVVIVTALLLLA